jgi:hypothetical protein
MAGGGPARSEPLSALQEMTGQQGETLAAQQGLKADSGHEERAGTAVSCGRRHPAGPAAHCDGQQGDDWQAEPGEDVPQA